MSLAERCFSMLVFPVVLGLVIAAAVLAMERGSDPAGVAGALTGIGAIVVLALERVFPKHRSWLHSKDDLTTDIAHAVNIFVVLGLLLGPFVLFLGLNALDWLSSRFGGTLWPTSWPVLAQLPLALVVAEFPKYWHHRLQHNTEFLWRFHATHHSCPRLYWLNAARFHPIDVAIDGTLGGLTLVALGAGIEILVLFNLVSGIHGYFQHSNLQLRLGPLNYFFSMAELHRWHHSPILEEANHNYGQNVIVWDLVFGSFFLPKDREPPEEIGIPDLPAFPMTFWPQMASPFTWRRIQQESRAL